MTEPVLIDKANQQHPALNFAVLRSAGIKLIQQMAGKTWTDFNLHDPGVTILEQLCYAITDLAYRTDFPISDLLLNEKGKIDYEKNAFFPREEILTTNPVTINDFRKVLIDEIPEIKNVWLYPVTSPNARGALTGLYKIVVQVSREVAEKLLSENKTDQEITDLVRRCFVSKRNLCEDLIDEIVILKPVKVAIEADIQVGQALMPEEILANVYHRLENSLNIPVRYFAEKEMIVKGYSIDEIYNGPFLKNGFIPDSELNDRKTIVDPTELIKTISQIEGVVSVKKLRIVNSGPGKHNKPLKIDELSFPLLDIKGSEQLIKLYRDSFELTIKRPVFRAILQKVREAENRSFISSFYHQPTGEVITGRYRNNEKYHSIQNQFPKVYGIGHEGLLSSASDLRKAQAKQLKAYLLFFEQIMANYLSQLSSLNDFFSTDTGKKAANTYYSGLLYDVPDLKELLKAFTSRKLPEGADASWEAFKKDRNNGYITSLGKQVETDQKYAERKNLLFDHLFARFNEFITTYPVQLYSSLYEPNLQEERVNAELAWKSDLLKNVARLGAGRVRAYDYLSGDSGDRVDFAWKMRMLLHVSKDSGRRRLTDALDAENVVVEPAGRKDREKRQAESEEPDEPGWLGEIPRILVDKAEIEKLVKQKRIAPADDLPHDAFLFKRQEVSVLKHALDIRNFRIGPDAFGGQGYMVLFKAPGEEQWTIISRFSSHGAAMKSLKSLITYVKNVNIQSEGFYIVEHILLRPDLQGPNFGFKFAGANGQTLLEHAKWATFKKREEAIGALADLLSGDEEITAEKLAPFCRINLYPDRPVSDPANTSEEREDIYGIFRSYVTNKEKFLSRFEMVTRGEDNSMISEDFFSLRMSVVFPSWPARFQDKNFREAAENLFRINVPAHVKVNFIWMNVSNMKKFESIYFDWKKFVSGDGPKSTRNELREALVQMLYKYR